MVVRRFRSRQGSVPRGKTKRLRHLQRVALLSSARAMHPAIEFQSNMLFSARIAPIAQPVEHLICNQGVGSSSLSGGTIFTIFDEFGNRLNAVS